MAADRTRGGSGRRYRPPEAQAVSKRNEQVRNEAAAGREQRRDMGMYGVFSLIYKFWIVLVEMISSPTKMRNKQCRCYALKKRRSIA